MEEFDFSVDISDRDWKSFFTQCEECHLLPPALAGLEDSGMSDIDDLGALLSKRDNVKEKREIETFHSEEAVADGPPVCEGSPQELFLDKHSSKEMESILSGSEEDVQMQSVNMFFEQMKSLSDCQRPVPMDHEGAKRIRPVKGERSLGGQSPCALPKNIPKFHSAHGVATGAIKTSKHVSAIRNTNSGITDESSSESCTSLYVKHPYLKTKLHIESSSENTANEQSEHHYPHNKPTTITPHSNKGALTDNRCMGNGNNYLAQQKSVGSCRNTGLVRNGKWTEDKSTQVSQSDSENPYKLLSKESSSSCASIKRKRRKKRRLNVEPAERFVRRERLYSSEDDLFTWRRNVDPSFSKNLGWPGFKHQQGNYGFMPSLSQCKLSSSLPAGVESDEIRMEAPPLSAAHHRQHESIYPQYPFGSTGLTKVWYSTESDIKDDMDDFSGITNGDNASEENLNKLKEGAECVSSTKNTNGNEVKSITNAIFQSTESLDPGVAMGQICSRPSSEPALREEAETEKVIACQRAAALQQQLDVQCPVTCHHHMVENMTPPQNETVMSTETVTELLDPTLYHASERADSAAGAQSPVCSYLIMNGNATKPSDLSSKHELSSSYNSDMARDINGEDLTEFGKMHQHELKAHPESQNVSLSSSNLSSSSSHSPETQHNVLLSNEDITQSLENLSSSSNALHFQAGNKDSISKNDEIKTVLQMDCSQFSNDFERDECRYTAVTNSHSEKNRESDAKSDHPVFAMSSFWKEMEKLTINDILGCRKEKTMRPSFLPSLQENHDCFTVSDSGCCSQVEERMFAINDPVDCHSNGATSNPSPRGVPWESEQRPVSRHPENIYRDPTTVNAMTKLTAAPGLRKISKNISMQNLHALGSGAHGNKCQPGVKPDEGKGDDVGCIPEDPGPVRKPKPSSVIENFKLSLTDIYSHFFSEPSDTVLESDYMVSNFTNGDSVPENYDNFFSEFDTDSFFYTDEVKPELVPIYSCRRSPESRMGFYDAYDHFLFSASDNSSSESDEEDQHAPIRVVTRFTRKASSKDIVTDAYEHFYTDRDLQQDFFKTTFSFRNAKLTDDNVQEHRQALALAADPVKDESASFVLENQTALFPDSLLCNFDDRVITKLPRPLVYQDLQTAVAIPNVDGPLLPLKQSDMCLICIAFASWVLKTADPQAGDAWKAALLANVSALSAIRYLRRYIKGEMTAVEKRPNLKPLCS